MLSSYIFWICWSIELLLLLFLLVDELRLKHLSVNPFIYLGFFYLAVSVVLYRQAETEKIALYLVGIPGVVLAFFGFIIAVHALSGGRWN